VLTAPGLEGVEPGAAVVDGAAGAALRAYAALPRSARRSVRAAFAPSVERISFSLEGGLLVRWGAAERLTDKRRVLSALLARLARTGTAAAYVDVRVPEHPAVSGTPARAG
jgi:cell division septal protein FtsQ